MGMQSKGMDDLRTRNRMNEILFKKLHDMHNGSITIIKQDNTVIQINIRNRFCFTERDNTDIFMEEVVS
jgi:hypothetical protein